MEKNNSSRAGYMPDPGKWLWALIVLLITVCSGTFHVSAQNMEFSGNSITWSTSGTTATSSTRYQAIGWTFSVYTKNSDQIVTNSHTYYLGNAKAKGYEKSKGITQTVTVKGKTTLTDYSLSTEQLIKDTGIEIREGSSTITANAIIEIYNGSTSYGVYHTKAAANAAVRKYGFGSDFDGAYTGYYAQNVSINYYYVKTEKSNGVASVSPEEKWVKKGSKVKLTATVKKGYVWQGWKYTNYLDFSTGIYGKDNASYTLTNVQNNWLFQATASPIQYQIVFDGNGADSGKMVAEKMTYDVEKKLSANKFTRKGYVFAGWNTKKSGSGSSNQTYKDQEPVLNLTSVEGKTITLYAQWTPITYTICFDGNGADTGDMPEQEMTYDEKKKLTKNRFVRTGYTFVGWNTSKSGSGNSYGDQEIVSNLSTTDHGRITLYAQWKANVLTVYYHRGEADVTACSGYGVNAEGLATKDGKKVSTTIAYSSKQMNLKNVETLFSRKGYAGDNNWASGSTDGTLVVSQEKETQIPASWKKLLEKGNATLQIYARWNPNTLTIYYNCNGANTSAQNGYQIGEADKLAYDSADNRISTQIHYDDSDMDLVNVETLFYRFGYQSMKSWGLEPDCTVSVSQNDKTEIPARFFALIQNKDAAITLYANWAAIPSFYKVEFRKNGQDVSGSMENQNIQRNVKTALTKNQYTRKNYTFTGWNTEADGSGESYADMEQVVNLAAAEETISLYAMWRYTPDSDEETENSYTICYHEDDTAAASPIKTIVPYGSYTKTATVEELGYDTLAKHRVFIGWMVKRTYQNADGVKRTQWLVSKECNWTWGTLKKESVFWAEDSSAAYPYYYLYRNGLEVAETAPAGGNVDFYAVWSYQYKVNYYGSPSGSSCMDSSSESSPVLLGSEYHSYNVETTIKDIYRDFEDLHIPSGTTFLGWKMYVKNTPKGTGTDEELDCYDYTGNPYKSTEEICGWYCTDADTENGPEDSGNISILEGGGNKEFPYFYYFGRAAVMARLVQLSVKRCSEINLYVVWKPSETYNVTLDPNGGSFYVRTSGNPVCEVEERDTSVTKQVKANAQVSFLANDYEYWKACGDEAAVCNAFSADKAYLACIPSRKGYQFDHWQLTGSGMLSKDVRLTVTGDVTLTARWKKVLTLDLNGGSVRQITGAKVESSENGCPVYQFDTRQLTGNYTITASGTSVLTECDLSKTAQIMDTLSSSAEDIRYFHKVRNSLGAGNGDQGYFVSVPSKSGCVFVGWEVMDAGESRFWQAGDLITEQHTEYGYSWYRLKHWDSSMTLRAVWESYTLFFDNQLEGAYPLPEAQNVSYGMELKPVVVPGCSYTVTYKYMDGRTADTKETADCKFLGYYSHPSQETEKSRYYGADGQSVKTYDRRDDLTVYAHWNLPEVTLPTPVWEDHQFLGWYTLEEDGFVYQGRAGAAYALKEDVTLYAMWGNHTVTFDTQGGSQPVPASIPVCMGEDMISVEIPKRSYTVTYVYGNGQANTIDTAEDLFVGYFTTRNGTMSSADSPETDDTQYYYNDGTPIHKYDREEDLTLYAHWNAGSVTTPQPKWEGQQFLGWYEKTDTSGGEEFSYVADGNEVFAPRKNIVLYARWAEEGADQEPTITAADRYFTLEDAREGRITEEELFASATAIDAEDGRIEAGIHEKNSFVLVNYLPEEFTKLTKDAVVTESYRVTDSAGHTVTKQIRVYVTDTECVTDPDGKNCLRFISLAYLDALEELGGLRRNSVWRTQEWNGILRQAMTDLQN